MEITNFLKKPILWAYTVLLIYILLQLVAFLAYGPTPDAGKIVLGMLGLLLCITFGVFVTLYFTRPIPSNNILLIFSPYVMGLLGLVQICFGSASLYIILDSFPAVLKLPHPPWIMYMVMNETILLPVGMLIFIFSALQLISNRKSVQPKI